MPTCRRPRIMARRARAQTWRFPATPYCVRRREAVWIFAAEERSEKRQAAAAAIAKMRFAQKRVEAMAVTMRRSAEGGKEKTKNRASSDCVLSLEKLNYTAASVYRNLSTEMRVHCY